MRMTEKGLAGWLAGSPAPASAAVAPLYIRVCGAARRRITAHRAWSRLIRAAEMTTGLGLRGEMELVDRDQHLEF
jgi:hypothetical protein